MARLFDLSVFTLAVVLMPSLFEFFLMVLIGSRILPRDDDYVSSILDREYEQQFEEMKKQRDNRPIPPTTFDEE